MRLQRWLLQHQRRNSLFEVPAGRVLLWRRRLRAVCKFFCLPGFWRNCTRTGDAWQDSTGAPCEIQWDLPCLVCGANDLCVNNTLVHCPENSVSLPGSSNVRDCTCNAGYKAEYEN